MTTYYVRLLGPGSHGQRVPGVLLRDLLDVLVEGAKRAVRLRIEGRSTARGTPPRWLGSASMFEVVGIREGSTILVLEAPELESAAPELADQIEVFQEFDMRATSLGLFRESVSEAIAGDSESDMLDRSMLDTVTSLDRIFERGIERIEFSNGAGSMTGINREDLTRAKELQEATPPEQKVMVAGRLNALRHHDRMFALILESGVTLRGVADEAVATTLGPLWGQMVVVSGTATFKPSGRISQLEADRVMPATGDTSLWSDEPRAFYAISSRLFRQQQGPRSGINAIVGQWPGDEDDEEIMRFLKALS